MKILVFSPKAEADIDEIYDYTEEHWGFEKAEAYTFELRDACRMLAEGVRSGRTMQNLKRNHLALSFRSHVVIYRQTDSHLAIIRILHQRMNVRRHL